MKTFIFSDRQIHVQSHNYVSLTTAEVWRARIEFVCPCCIWSVCQHVEHSWMKVFLTVRKLLRPHHIYNSQPVMNRHHSSFCSLLTAFSYLIFYNIRQHVVYIVHNSSVLLQSKLVVIAYSVNCRLLQ